MQVVFGKNYAKLAHSLKGKLMKIIMLFLVSFLSFFSAFAYGKVFIGSDSSQFRNPFIQPQDPPLSGGDRDQTLQFGDILFGTAREDIIIGALGADVIFAQGGDDIIIGGSEGGNPFSRDRVFAGEGDDLFVWAPGDGTDFIDFGRGNDILLVGVFGLQNGNDLIFPINNTQRFLKPFLDPTTGFPIVDALNAPGFCEILDDSDSAGTAKGLSELGIENVVRFVLRQVRNDFENGVQNTDNGLRVSLHVKGLELLICANRDGSAIDVIDLRVNPPSIKPIGSAPQKIKNILRSLQPGTGV